MEAENIKTGEFVAVKVFNKDTYEFSRKTNRFLIREVSIMSKIKHHSILKFIGYSPVNFKYKPKPSIITELMKCSLQDIADLEQKGNAPKEWNMTRKLIAIYNIASAMKYLHSKHVIHNDLKPNNILLDEYLFPKICDFNMSTINLSFIRQESFGSDRKYLKYMAPEFMHDDKPTYDSDVYSFSLIVYLILTGQEPFGNEKADYKLFNSIINQLKRPELYPSIPKCYQELMCMCWDSSSYARPSFEKIVEYLENECLFELCEYDVDDYLDYISGKLTLEKMKATFTKVEYDIKPVKEQNKIQDFQLSPILDKYRKIKNIGFGGFANVYEIMEKETGHLFAAKILKLDIYNISEQEMLFFKRELSILRSLDHKLIIKYIEDSPVNFKGAPKPTIIFEIAKKSLAEILELDRKGQADSEWDETQKLINIYGIACGMKYLHSISIIHRDLKPENILLDNNLYPKISDFGFSKDIFRDDHKTETVMGTSRYIAPEIHNRYLYSKASDVYAFSLIVYEIVTGKQPFIEFKFAPFLYFQIVQDNLRPPIDDSIPLCYRNLIESCWSSQPEERPTFEKIIDQIQTDPEFRENIDIDKFNEYSESIDGFYFKKDEIVQQQKEKPKQSQPNTNKIQEISEKIIEEEYTFDNINNCTFLDLSNFKQIDLISKEEFTKTVKVVEIETGIEYYAQISNIDMNQFNKNEIDQISNEINIISKLNHSTILKIKGFSPTSFKNEPKPVFVTEISSRRTLDDILELKRNGICIKKWNSTKKLIGIYGIAHAMKYLHSHEIVHRNLTPKNIFVNKSLQPKIYNFGFFTNLLCLNNKTFNSSGRILDTSIYYAPEIIRFKEYSKASDVYAFAMILYEIITDEKPLIDIHNNKPMVSCNIERPQFTKPIPDCYKKMIKKCWSQDPNERPTFDEIVYTLENDTDFLTPDVNKVKYHEYISNISCGEKISE